MFLTGNGKDLEFLYSPGNDETTIKLCEIPGDKVARIGKKRGKTLLCVPAAAFEGATKSQSGVGNVVNPAVPLFRPQGRLFRVQNRRFIEGISSLQTPTIVGYTWVN